MADVAEIIPADQAMEDPESPSVVEPITSAPSEEKFGEPSAKKARIRETSMEKSFKLEERLNGILCCTVCLDLPNLAIYQCANGHLMCASCLSHLLADARLKDETATCALCRCEISRTLCTRNLAAEKAISELPAPCKFCDSLLARSSLAHHESEACQERHVQCKYTVIGCPWKGPFHARDEHEQCCSHPKKSGSEIMESINSINEEKQQEMKIYKTIYDLLSMEKITFNDLQLKPYRTDDFLTKLFYETSRFTAFNLQWVLKANVNDNQKDPNLTANRYLTYQLQLKSRIQKPMMVYYLALKGPYGDFQAEPALYDFEFTSEATETPSNKLPIGRAFDCNRLLSGKNINVRLILFQIQK